MYKLNIFIDSALMYQDSLYFFDRLYNSIWKSDKEMNSLEFLRSAKQDVAISGFHSFGIFKNKNSFFICSQVGTDILEYQFEKNCFCKYEYEKAAHFNNEIYNNIAYKNKIFLFPVIMNHPILIFDMEKKEYYEINSISHKKCNAGFCSQNGNNAYIPELDGQTVYDFDMETLGIQQINFLNRVNLSSVCSVQRVLYAMDKNKKVLWKKEIDGEESEIILENAKNGEAISKMIFYDKYVVLFPRWEKFLYLYDIETKSVLKFEVPLKKDAELCGGGSLCFGHYIYNSKIFFLPWIFPQLYIFDLVTQKFEKRYLKSSDMSWLSCRSILSETEIELDDFIEFLCSSYDKNKFTIKKGIYGEQIHKWMMSTI